MSSRNFTLPSLSWLQRVLAGAPIPPSCVGQNGMVVGSLLQMDEIAMNEAEQVRVRVRDRVEWAGLGLDSGG